MAYSDLEQYREAVRRELSTHGLPSQINKVKLFGVQGKNAQAGLLRAVDIQFPDGAILDVEESIAIVNRSIVRRQYKYHYERAHGDFLFRYDKDPSAAKHRRYQHPECHLHVAGDAHENIRYFTHEISLIEVLRFILSSFYEQSYDDIGEL